MRTSTKTVTFVQPFVLGGLDGVQPAGTYVVETDEERLPTVSLTAYRRSATWLRLPRRRDGAESPAGFSQTAAIDPAELDLALGRDAALG